MTTTRASTVGPDGRTPLVGSSLYATRAYWERRFGGEIAGADASDGACVGEGEHEAKEWLASWAQLGPVLLPLLAEFGCAPAELRITLVGCGSSNLAADLCDAGFSCVTATDFSSAVIARMRRRHGASHPSLVYCEADMLRGLQPLADASADVVIDKAAMDAVLADGGDAWFPRPPLLRDARRVCRAVRRGLRPGGLFAQLSFSQPHFRRQFLLQDLCAAEDEDEREDPDGSKEASEAVLEMAGNCGEALTRPVPPSGGGGDGDEYEPDLSPVVPAVAVLSAPDLGATPWSSFETFPVAAGLGYFLYVARRKGDEV